MLSEIVGVSIPHIEVEIKRLRLGFRVGTSQGSQIALTKEKLEGTLIDVNKGVCFK